MDDSELADPPPPDEAYPSVVPMASPSSPVALEVEPTRVSFGEEIGGQGIVPEILNPLKSEPIEDDLQLLQSDQLKQEMSWMEEFNKNTLGNPEVSLQPNQLEDSDPLQYIQEPPEEKRTENPEEESEEDPEERPQEVELAEERSGENQEEPVEEPVNVGAEVDEDDEDDELQPNNEDPQDNNDDENEDQPDEEDDDDADNEDEDEDGEVVDEDMGTVSPTSTVTTV